MLSKSQARNIKIDIFTHPVTLTELQSHDSHDGLVILFKVIDEVIDRYTEASHADK